MENYAFVMTGIGKMEKRKVPMPTVRPNDVMVKIECVGICGSDLHFLEMGKVATFEVTEPIILGHECAGVVVEVGDEVKTLKAGDRVALEPGTPCGMCEHCRSGKYNLCNEVIFLATPPNDGSLCNYMSYPEHMCFKLPDGMSSKQGALVEPLAVGMHATNQTEIKFGDSVVITGAGCIGLVTLLAAKAKGAGKIIISDVEDKRLEYAKKLGADVAVNVKNQSLKDEVAKLNNGEGADIVFETAGNDITIAETAHLVRRGGNIVLVGLAVNEIIPYNFAQIMTKEAKIASVFRYRGVYPGAIEAVASGQIDVEQIVTHEFDFSETVEAFDFAIKNKSEVVKAVINL